MIVRPASKQEFQTAVEWATEEGWNPGIDDLEAFFSADPDGFLMGFEGDEPVSSISVVKYGADYGFLGFYIVRSDRRGAGVGLATWTAGLEYLKGRTIGLDGVVAQQANYEKSGFVNAGRNIRFSGIPSLSPMSGIAVERVTADDLIDIINMDKGFFPTDRSAFLKSWLDPDASTRGSFLVRQQGVLHGYGTIRQCVEGFKIGPLYADSQEVAAALFTRLCELADAKPVVLDVPESNVAAVQLAEQAHLEPVFETARMYFGNNPNLPLETTYGITTFELG